MSKEKSKAVKKKTVSKFFAVFEQDVVWGIGKTKKAATKDAEKWIKDWSRGLRSEYRPRTKVKKITKAFFTFIENNSGATSDLKKFKGQKYVKD